jgi:uncharacterized cupredoxin-like copper-binding protein
MFRFPVLDPPLWAAPIAVALGGAVVLAGCGSSTKAAATPSAPATSSAASSPSSPASSPAASGPAAAATTVTATETEFKISLSQATFAPGSYTFKATNSGKFPHALTIEGPGVDKTSTAILTAGTSGSMTVTLQAGSYEIWCPVDSHKSKGMDMHITVGPSGAASTDSGGSHSSGGGDG